MENLTELGRRLLALREAQAYAPANVPQLEPQGYQGPMPNFQAMQTPGGPRYQGGVDIPFGDGTLGASGSLRPNGQSPDWSAMLNFRKSF
jgi:hypothetical protein